MVLLEFSMTPLAKGESVSRYVSRSLEVIEKSGLDYRLHAMGTIVEGEIDQVLGVLKQCFETMSVDFSSGEAVILMTRAPSMRSMLEGASTRRAMATWEKGMLIPRLV